MFTRVSKEAKIISFGVEHQGQLRFAAREPCKETNKKVQKVVIIREIFFNFESF